MALENATVNATTNSTVTSIDNTAESFHQAFRAALESTHQPWITWLVQNPVWFAIVSILIGLALSYLVVFLSRTIVKAFTMRTETDLDDKLLACLTNPAAFFLFLLSLTVALVPLGLSSTSAFVVNKLIITGLIFIAGMVANRILSTLIMHYGTKIVEQTESDVDDHMLPIIRKMVTAVVYCVAVLFMLGVWGVQLAPFLAGAGIVGIALAFSLQETLKNVFGGVSLAFDKVYTVGDRVKLADGTTGKVLDVTLRSTKIRTFDGNMVIVPNGKIANEIIQTFTQPTPETRVTVSLSVAYGTDLDKAREVILKAIKGAPHQIDKPEDDKAIHVDFYEFGASGISLNAIYWVDSYTEAYDSKLAAIERIYKALQKAKIEIPYPTQVIYTKKG